MDERPIPDASLTNLLLVGAETWESLCAAGILTRSEWSDDQKWTAIGMMWGFSERNIARIRYLKAGADVTVLAEDNRSTAAVKRQVRIQGQRALAAMSKALRHDYDLPDEER